MRERPIIFNSEMVRALLDGRKTQTRRIMKVQPSEEFSPMNMALETDYTAHWYTPGVVDKDGFLQPGKKQVFGVAGENEGYICPFGAVGDRLWVRETFAGHYLDDDQIQDIKDGRDKARDLCEYRADYPSGSEAADGWTPSIHMPRWASRITLEITGVRVERLQNISEADACAEGIRAGIRRTDHSAVNEPVYCNYLAANLNDASEWFERASDGFISLWQSIYGAESWQHSPFVWVIEFKRVEGQ